MEDPIAASVKWSNEWWKQRGQADLKLYDLITSEQIALFAFAAGFAAGIQFSAENKTEQEERR